MTINFDLETAKTLDFLDPRNSIERRKPPMPRIYCPKCKRTASAEWDQKLKAWMCQQCGGSIS